MIFELKKLRLSQVLNHQSVTIGNSYSQVTKTWHFNCSSKKWKKKQQNLQKDHVKGNFDQKKATTHSKSVIYNNNLFQFQADCKWDRMVVWFNLNGSNSKHSSGKCDQQFEFNACVYIYTF